ncbi:MAG: LLM class flavin-dependent oxidoreductase [Xanthobacteraceae bacterium]
MALYFGIFDHVDYSGAPLAEFYENRLKLAEAYDRAGFHIYLVAEHHATPLGMAPSPSVYLAAVAQRTKRIRLGPLVYTLPLYHPIRLIEEICMLDNISGGRLEFGVGKGISPIETAFYGIDPKNSEKMFAEALQVILKGLTNRTLSFAGEFYNFKDVPFELEPYQKPHPPLWAGVPNPESAERAARRGMSAVSNQTAEPVRAMAERYFPAFQPNAASREPRLGMTRHLVLAENEADALAIARRAYKRWYEGFMKLWWQYDMKPPYVSLPPTIDGLIQAGAAVVGTPARVREQLQAQIDLSRANFLGCRFAYGDLTLAESLRSIELFAREVMPHLRGEERVAAE